jgi:hypothetical protein
MSLSEKDITLFEPSTRDMLIDYPELKDYEAFTKISKADLKFVWYVSNRTSPIIRVSKLKRIKQACELAYGKKRISNNERVGKMYNDHDLPDEIVEAIDAMSSFNPSFRMRAKLLNEHNFEVLQSLSYISDEEMVAMDLDEKNKLAKLVVMTSSALPKMIEAAESGYGIRVKKEVKEKFELKANISDVIDRIEKTD